MPLKKNSVVEVCITEILDEGLKVKILDYQEDGWIYKSDLTRPVIDDMHKDFSVGDSFYAIVTQVRRDGCINLSKVKYDKRNAWEILTKKQHSDESIQARVTKGGGNGYRVAVLGLEGFIPHDKGGKHLSVGELLDVVPYEVSAKEHKLFFYTQNYHAIQKSKELSNIKDGDIIQVEVLDVNKWNAMVGVNGWMCDIVIPKRELAIPEPEFAYDIVHIGDKISVYVVSVNDGYLSKVQADRIMPWRKLEEYCQENSIVRAEIKQVIGGGLVAYVDGLRGFIPADQVALSHVNDLSKYIGQALDVSVMEIDGNRQRLVLSRRYLLKRHNEEKLKRRIEERIREDERRRQELKRQEEEKKRYIRMAQERNPFTLNKFLHIGEKILAELNIYDSNLNLYITQNCFFVVGRGVKEIFPLQQLSHVSLYWYDDDDDNDDSIFVYGDASNKVGFDILDTSRNMWRFYVPEDLSSSVIDFIKVLLLQNEKSNISSIVTSIKTPSPTPAVNDGNSTNDDIWN